MVDIATCRFSVHVWSSFFISQVLKRLQQKDGGRPQRGGQERGDMENQEADQKFRSCPWVSKQLEACIDLRDGTAVLEYCCLWSWCER